MTIEKESQTHFNTLESIDVPAELGLTRLPSGKVRERFIDPNGNLVLITTDRVSAFDRVLGTIPQKGKILNRLSEFWFEKTRDILPNHMLATIDENVMVCKPVQILPVEVVVCGYMKGSTGTSIWPPYQEGQRNMYGIHFREGYKYGDRLDEIIIKPTTKEATGHDQPISEREIVTKGIVDKDIWEKTRTAAISIYKRGEEIAAKRGLILVDSKIEFGIDTKGDLLIVDELLTPDSSAFWLAGCNMQDPDLYDKEYLRKELKKLNYSGEGPAPTIPNDIELELSRRYISVYERLTGKKVVSSGQNIKSRIITNLNNYYSQQTRVCMRK